LAGKSNDMTIDNIKSLLNCVRKIGCHSVLFSGGEPLTRPDIVDILEYARGQGLHIGLLTSGILHNRNLEQIYDALAANVNWVQVSIDSTSDTKYIRQGGSYEGVKNFVLGIRSRGIIDLQIACTIQKANLVEAKTQEFYYQLLNDFPEVSIRFKFAHGPWGKEQFLLGKQEVSEVVKAWKIVLSGKAEAKSRTNLEMMSGIMNEDQHSQSVDCVVEGMPVAHLYKPGGALHNQPCRVLRTTILIDAGGDIYPCCYLYNDNLAEWDAREEYKIGTWTSENPESLNLAWQSYELRNLRERTIPINENACGRCTRHYRQNRYLAQLDGLLSETSKAGMSKLAEHSTDTLDVRHDPFWL
jgi:MoaA/NifB/PqqE/SkfB family radical SAM enzyme